MESFEVIIEIIVMKQRDNYDLEILMNKLENRMKRMAFILALIFSVIIVSVVICLVFIL